MLKKRIAALIAGIALIVAVAGGSASVANGLVASDAPVAIACHTSGSSGGGC